MQTVSADQQLVFGYGGDEECMFGEGFDIQTFWRGNFTEIQVVDNTPPTIVIVNPLNGSNISTPVVFDITATDTFGVTSCWLSLDSWITNTTMTNTVGNTWQATNSTIAIGNYTVFFGCIDPSSNFNSTFSEFIVGEEAVDETTIWLWIFSIIFVIFITLMIIGFYTEQPFWTFMAGILFMLSGVYITITGFPGIDNVLFEYGIGVVIIGISIYILVASALEYMKDSEEGSEEKKEEK